MKILVNVLVFVSLLFCSAFGSNPDSLAAVKLPQTGQVATIKQGDDGSLQKGVAWPKQRFTDNRNGTVTDKLTGLTWLKQADCFNAMNWSDALSTANTLSAGTCGLTDNSRAGKWRVPNINELSSLVSIAAMNPALPDSPFSANLGGSGLSSYFWSSSTFAQVPYNAWMVYLDMGYVDTVSKKSLAHLLPVRGGVGTGKIRLLKTGQTVSYSAGDDGALRKGAAWPKHRFTDNRNGTVTDKLTSLVWFKNANCLDETIVGANMMKQLGLMHWTDAIDWTDALASGFCGLTDGSRPGDWRVPNRNELSSLIDRSQANPALPAGHPFSNVKLDGYWTSSNLQTYDGKPHSDMAWFVDGGSGAVSVDGAGAPSSGLSWSYVWPVRDGSRDRPVR